ncbi:hypothetical protein AAMO2058_000384500 [Amorphochlora amoebiformis]
MNSMLTLIKKNPKLALGVVLPLILVALRRVINSLRALARQKELKELADEKRRHRDAILEAMDLPECKREREIVQMTATELLSRMESGDLSSLEVTIAFCRAAKRLQGSLVCLAETDFETAIAMAKQRDIERKEGKIRGILHGLPVSIKDQIDMKEFDSTCGLSCRCFKPAHEDAVLVKLLRDAGAIPFVRTNVPQCLFLPECFNAIWGETKNPFNLERTCGGSSGGEAALIAARGSPLGMGSDIGGSIRGPAFFCGICGLKPTPGRTSYKGIAVPRLNGISGQKIIPPVSGPMARCVDDLNLAMEVLVSEKAFKADCLVSPIPWDKSIYEKKGSKKLKFGYFIQDGYFDLCSAGERAIRETVEALRKDGHEVLEVKWDFSKLVWGFVKCMSAEGGMRGFIEGLEGEKLHPTYSFIYHMANLPGWVRPIVSTAMGLLGKARVAKLVKEARARTTYDYWGAVGELDFNKKQLIKLWTEMGLDAMICAPIGLPAFPNQQSAKCMQSCSYTFMWNAVKFPAGVVPVTQVKPEEEPYEGRPDPITEAAKIANKGSAGLPMGVQIVSLPWRDELCLLAMKAVEDAVKWRIPLPPMALPEED